MGRKRGKNTEAHPREVVAEPLLVALFEGDEDAAIEMVAAGCDVEVEDQLGWRPLHRAAFGGLARATALLLQRHA